MLVDFEFVPLLTETFEYGAARICSYALQVLYIYGIIWLYILMLFSKHVGVLFMILLFAG